MKLKKYIAMAILLSGNVCSLSSHGAGYIGISTGSVKLDTGVTGLTGSASLDEKDTSFKLMAGKNITPTVSIEGFYVDYGEASVTGNAGDQFTIEGITLAFVVNNGKLESSASAFGASALFNRSVSPATSLYGEIGLARWDAEVNQSGPGIGTSTLTSDTGIDLYFGVGMKFNLNTQFSLALDYEIHEVDDSDVDLLSFYLIYYLK